jgi:hypothetical protein
MPDDKKTDAAPAPGRVKERRVETGFGGNDGHVWERVRDLEPDETPPRDSAPAAADEANHGWRQVS